MSIEVINTGIYPNDGTGDPLRTAYTKINHNFTQFAPVAFTGQYNSLYGIPSFAKVAHTGQYTDLIGTPVLGLLAFLNTINNSNWFGIPLAINHGGTGQVTAQAAFDALSPMNARGDMIYGLQYGAGYRLPVGGNGQVLSVANGIPTWANPTVPVINEITNITNQVPSIILPGEGAYVHYGVASGTNILSTTVSPYITSYQDGIFIELLCSNYNTGDVTLNNAGLGPLPVVWPDGTQLATHTLIPGGIVYLTKVGGVFQLIAGGVVGGAGSSVISGCLLNIIAISYSSTYTPSIGANKAVVFATGGGGSGGGAGAPTAAGQGGESGTTVLSFVNVSHSSPISCTIGAGGIPSNAGPATRSGNGGQTSFGSSAIAPGGKGGVNTTGALDEISAGSSNPGVFNILNFGSNPGFPPYGIYDNAGPFYGAINIAGGQGGASFWGGAGVGRVLNFLNGFNATGWGSGGGGAAYSGTTLVYGGYGSPGIIVIFEFS